MKWQAVCLAALWLVCAAVAAHAAPNPADGQYVLTLSKAFANGHDAVLYLDVRNGAGRLAFIKGGALNRMPGIADASKVRVAGGKVSGTVAFTIASDGYFPADNRTSKGAFTLAGTVAGNAVTGTFTGAGDSVSTDGGLTGQLLSRPANDAVLHLTMNGENVINHNEPLGRSRRIRFQVGLGKGVATGVTVEPEGSIVDVSCGAYCVKQDLRYKDGELSGTMDVVLQQQNTEKRPIAYHYAVQGVVIAEQAAGTLAVMQDGKTLNETGYFNAPVRREKAPKPGNCLYKVTLNDALGPGKFIDLYLNAMGGKLAVGFGTTPNFNNAMHTVDLSKLTLKGKRITGQLGVIINPDPWIPRDRQPIACAFTVDATIADSEVNGTFAGTAGGTRVEQTLNGYLDPKPEIGQLTSILVKVEDGLTGPEAYRNRAFINVTLDAQGHITGGTASNNHTKLKGTVTGGTLTLANGKLKGTINVTITNGDGAQPGDYSFAIDGGQVGKWIAGSFTAKYKGAAKTSCFWASISTK